jgi:hypothetical protein
LFLQIKNYNSKFILFVTSEKCVGFYNFRPGDVIICTTTLIGWLVLVSVHQETMQQPYMGMDAVIKFVAFVNMGHFLYRLFLTPLLPDRCLQVENLVTCLHYVVALSTQIVPLITGENRLVVALAMVVPFPHVFHTLYNIHKNQDPPGTKPLVYSLLWLLSITVVSVISLTLGLVAATYQNPMRMSTLSQVWLGAVTAYVLCLAVYTAKSAISAVCQSAQSERVCSSCRRPSRGHTVTERTPVLSGAHVPLYLGLLHAKLNSKTADTDKVIGRDSCVISFDKI